MGAKGSVEKQSYYILLVCLKTYSIRHVSLFGAEHRPRSGPRLEPTFFKLFTKPLGDLLQRGSINCKELLEPLPLLLELSRQDLQRICSNGQHTKLDTLRQATRHSHLHALLA